MITSQWTDERVTRLKRLQLNGLSCSQIAGELGGGVTRNSVIGKLHRLGLAPGRDVAGLRAVRARKGGVRSFKSRAPILGHEREKLLPPGERAKLKATREDGAVNSRERYNTIEVVDLAPDAAAQAVILLDLKHHHCRWPFGDPRDMDALKFCGAGIVKGSYCGPHHRESHQPTAARRI